MTKVQLYTEDMIAWIVERQLAGESAREVARGLIERFKLNYETNYVASRLRADAALFAERFAAGYALFLEKQDPEVRAAFDREPLNTLAPSDVCRILVDGPQEGPALLWLMARNPAARHLEYVQYLTRPTTKLSPRLAQLVVMGREAQQTGEEIRTTIFSTIGIGLASGTAVSNIVSVLRSYGYTIPESAQSATGLRKATLIAERKAGTLKTKAMDAQPKRVAPAPADTVSAPPVPVKNSMAELVEPPPPSRDRPGVTFFELRDSAVRKQCRFPLWNHTERLPLEQLRFCGAAHTNTHAYCSECAKGLFFAARVRIR